MRVQGANFQISGFQSAFRINVGDFGYSESEKLNFINDLLLGRIEREDLISKITDQNVPTVSLWNGNIVDTDVSTRSENVGAEDDQFSGRCCKLQGVFIGSLDSLNEHGFRVEEEADVFVVPIDGSEETPKPQHVISRQHQPNQVIDNLYQQLDNSHASVVKGELYCTKYGSKLNLARTPSRQNRFFEDNHKKPIHIDNPHFQKKSVGLENNYNPQYRSKKRCHERRKTQSIQPGMVKRLREKFAGSDTTVFRAKSECHEAKKSAEVGYHNSSSRSHVANKKVDIAINTDNFHLSSTQASKQRKDLLLPNREISPRKFRKVGKILPKECLKNSQNQSKHILFHHKTFRNEPGAAPSPSTGNSLAYNYWALSDSQYDAIFFGEEELEEEMLKQTENRPCQQLAWEDNEVLQGSSHSSDSYEDCLGLDPTCYFDYLISDDDSSHRNVCPACGNASCSSTCRNHLQFDCQKNNFFERGESSKSFSNRKSVRDSELQQCQNGKEDSEVLKPIDAATFATTKKGTTNHFSENGRASSQKYRRQTHPRYHPTISPGPRSVDFIKYPFTESSSEDNFKIDDNVTKRTSFRGSRSPTSTPRQPYNIKQKVPDNAESLLEFEELKKENDIFASLHKQLARGLHLKDAEDSDDSIANPQKVAYDERVRQYTKQPPALKPKTSLTSEDQLQLGILQYPEPSGECGRKVLTRAARPDRRKQSLDEARRRLKSTSKVRNAALKDLHDTAYSSGSDYYTAPQPSAGASQKRLSKHVINHKKRNLTNVPIIRKNFSASFHNAFSTLPKESFANSNGKLFEQTNQNHLSIRSGRHVCPAEKPHMDSKPHSNLSKNITVSEKNFEQEKVIVKPAHPLGQALNVLDNKESKKLSGNSKLVRNHHPKIVQCTPSHEAILCAHECPVSLSRGEWDINDTSFGEKV